MNFKIVNASADDRWEALEWVIEEKGWNHGKADFKVWQKAFGDDDFIALAAKDSQNGALYGLILGAQYKGQSGYIGEYIVRKDVRGNGIGKALWDTVMTKLESLNVALSVAFGPMLDIYQKKGGFTYKTDWLTAKTTVHQLKITNLNVDPSITLLKPSECSSPVIDDLIAYDRQIVAGVNRENWLRLWIHHPEGHSTIAVNNKGCVTGYIVIRPGSLGRLRVGPLYANDQATIESLIKQVLSQYDTETLLTTPVEFIAIDSSQALANVLAKLSDDRKVILSAHLFTKGIPDCDWQKIHCLADLEVNFV